MKDRIATLVGFLSQISLPLLAILIPVFFLPITIDPFGFNKRYLLLFLATFSLITWIIHLLFRRRVTLTITPSSLPLFLLSISFIVSSLVQSPAPYLSLMGKTASIVALTILFFVTTSIIPGGNLTQATLLGLSAAVSISSIVAILSFFKITLPYLPANLQGDSLTLLGFLLPLLPLLVYLGLKAKSLANKITFLASAALALSASATQVSLLFIQKTQTPLLLPFKVGWSIAVDIFKSGRSAFLGVGPENFISAFTRLRPLELNSHPLYWNVRFPVSSNEVFDVLTTTGILGLVLIVTVFYRPLRTILTERLYKKSTLIFAITLGLISYLISFLILPTSVTSLTIAIVLLILLSLELKEHQSESVYNLALSFFALKVISRPDSHKEEPLSAGYTSFAWLFSVLLMIPVVFFWLYAGRAYAASMATRTAINNINSNAKLAYDKQIEAYTLEPQNPLYRVNFAQTSLALANNLATKTNLTDQDRTTITQLIQQAIRESKNAAQLAPTNVTAWENLALTYKQLLNFAEGATDWSIATYNQAIALDPSNPSLRLDLGGVFYAKGDYDNAIRLFGQAVDLKPNWANAHYNLAAAYKGKGDYSKAFTTMEQVLKLLDANSVDYDKAQKELDILRAMIPGQSSSNNTPSDTGNLELVTPTPIQSNQNKITLPEDSGPNLPSSPSANPQ